MSMITRNDNIVDRFNELHFKRNKYLYKEWFPEFIRYMKDLQYFIVIDDTIRSRKKLNEIEELLRNK